jgi:hypothetical protein
MGTDWLLNLNLRECMVISLRIAAIAALVEALQNLYIRHEFTSNGLFSWRVRRRTNPLLLRSNLSWLLDRVMSYPSYCALMLLQFVTSLIVLIPNTRNSYHLAAWTLLLIKILSQIRNSAYGVDGSSGMQTILLAGLAVYFGSGSSVAQTVAVWFIAVHVMLAYLTSGVAKLFFSVWRDGKALEWTFGTTMYGDQRLLSLLQGRPLVGKLLSWSVLSFECILPLLVIISPTCCLMFIVLGILFHFAVASTMRLNSFMFTFTGCYPALLYCSVIVHGLIPQRFSWL